ncbi:MAG: Do family serine endopeptidase [Pseudomonadota bacterium]
MTRLKATLLAGAIALAPLAAPAAPLVNLQSFAPLVEAVEPAVVTVTVSGARRDARTDMAPELEEFMERFFRDRPEFRDTPERPRRGIGSGFIIDADGIIVTNNHVVAGADDITVVLSDGTELEAELVGRDTRIDIAVLRVQSGAPLPTVEWGDSDTIAVGDWAIAIGNPLGLNGTVTAGIVSARGRDINSGPYDDFLQVDAAINRGNSGGPLFDVEGRVIGVNTAIISPSGGNVGLGFAIPAAQAQDIVADLLDDGVVERGWIGVSIQPVTRAIADSLGLETAQGALVADIVPGSPAETAGLRPGDVILGFGDTAITQLRDLTRGVAAAEIGADRPLEIWRAGRAQVLTITPDLLAAADAGTPARVLPAGAVDLPELGLTLETDGTALVVAQAPGDSGLRPGDRLVSLNQTPADDPAALRNAVAEAQRENRDSVLILVDRDGARRFVTLPLGQA